MSLNHNTTRKPKWWCDNCEAALYEDEAIEIPLFSEQGCWGATTLYKDVCGCGCDLELYRFQDEVRNECPDSYHNDHVAQQLTGKCNTCGRKP